MVKLKTTIRVTEVDIADEDIHIPSSSRGAGCTLCGYVDVFHEYLEAEDYPPNCPICFDILNYCKKLKISK